MLVTHRRVEVMANEASSIAVRVQFMGDLPALTGQRTLVVTLPESSTVGDLMKSLSKSYGDAFTCRVFSAPGTLHHYMVVFLNGQNIEEVGGFRATLADSEVEVVMLPMFEGG